MKNKEKERFIIMKSKTDFINFYHRIFEKVLNEYTNKLKKILLSKLFKLIIEQVFIIVITFISYYLFNHYHLTNFKYIGMFIIIIGVIIFVLFLILNIRLFLKTKSELNEEINEFIYESILNFLSNNEYVYDKNTQLAEEDFDKMNLFNLDILNYTGSNLTASVCENKKFVMCDVSLYDVISRIKTDTYYNSIENVEYIINYHYKDKINIFKGLYYETTINHYNDEYIYLIPDNINDKFVRKNIYHYIKYSGHRLELENLDFEKRYDVFSINELKSRYILSLTLMEKINHLDEMVDGKKYFVFKKDGRVGIFINNYQIASLLKQNISLFHKIDLKYIMSFFYKVRKLYKISMIMEDINPYGD